MNIRFLIWEGEILRPVVIWHANRRDLAVAGERIADGVGAYRELAPRASTKAGGALDKKFDTEFFSDFSAKTLEGSFSAVSTPIFASKYSFCSVFRDLQDCHTFAPVETQTFRKFLSNFFILVFFAGGGDEWIQKTQWKEDY